MWSIILSFFILVTFSNVKAATFQDENNNNHKPIAYASVAQPTIAFEHVEKNHVPYLQIVHDTVRDGSKNIKYTYEGGNYHCIITDFDIYIDNSSQSLKIKLTENGKEGLIKGSSYFIAYIKDIIKYLISQHMHKYDFEEKFCANIWKLTKDLKDLIYDKFNQKLEQDLIKYETGPENEKFHKMAKEYLELLVNNSALNFKGYFIKTKNDGNYTDLCKNKSFYFNILISKDVSKYDNGLKFLEPDVAESVANLMSNP
ncbi:fam-d protein [Plasmodium chabaudi chabaudi]|uniref:Fam-d protein n=1 Tax=Plasmodium chabaudi chabaudi TaxID=31271 RepID=A0A4V6M9C2_PLACU|nr:fam-d protein [Plasmodium chabaudi chabaudi]VTZ68859.1 fam-d protein [Plasmodium chabaudi chabaudi]|eukprot:XP_744424.1 fam-d protein [Plasmodium chabaudi chabaudi]